MVENVYIMRGGRFGRFGRFGLWFGRFGRFGQKERAEQFIEHPTTITLGLFFMPNNYNRY